MAFSVKPPVWFWIVAGLLLLWEAIGVYAFVAQLSMGAESWPEGMEYDRDLYAAMPVWYNWVYGVATVGGLLGALSLLLRRSLAVPLYGLSLIAVVVMFGYVLGTTDIIAHKGFAAAAGFPIVIFLLGVLAVWVSRLAQRRGWLS